MLHFHVAVFSEYLGGQSSTKQRRCVAWNMQIALLRRRGIPITYSWTIGLSRGILNWKSSHHSTLSCLCIGLPPKHITYYLFTYLLSCITNSIRAQTYDVVIHGKTRILNRDHATILIPGGKGGALIVIDCIFLFLFSFLKPQIPGGPPAPHFYDTYE